MTNKHYSFTIIVRLALTKRVWQMKIYIFRHAQKSIDFSKDPDLTEEGHSQANRLLEKVLKNELPTPTQLWASPKKRTFSTLNPLAEHLQLTIQAHEALHEQHGTETLQEFRARIKNLFHSLEIKSGEVIFICSHFDWAAEAMHIFNSDIDLSHPKISNWSPGQHVGFHVDSNKFFKFIELSTLPKKY